MDRSEYKPPGTAEELGAFLRSRRERLDPKELGIAKLKRRRARGLRREEVAERAGIGTDWYVRLEQGRDVRPSAATIDALARALLLTEAERSHLHTLTQAGTHRSFAREDVPPALERILQDLPVPAYLTGQRWDLLSWNVAATDLFGDFGTLPTENRNILFYMLCDPRAQELFGSTWESEAGRMVAQFRLDFGTWAGDPAFEALLTSLRANCKSFDALWDSHEVRGQKTGIKRLHHPIDGAITVEYATLQANDNRRVKLVLYRFLDARKTPGSECSS